MANTPTYFIDGTATTARALDVPDADWMGGCNLAGSCAMGVGIATDVANLTGDPTGWTLLDQDGDPRTPQGSQHIGGTGLGGTYPSSGGSVGKGTVAIIVGTPSVTGDGTASNDGEASLTDLATGWSGVVPPP